MNKTKEITLQDITTWAISADHKARPRNPYIVEQRGDFTIVNVENTTIYADFKAFATQHTYACSETLLPGDYPAEMFELVWQYKAKSKRGITKWLNATQKAIDKCISFENFKNLCSHVGSETRQYLQLKQHVPSPHAVDESWEKDQEDYYELLGKRFDKPESKEVETIEQAADIKYRVGRKLGSVILTVNGETEIGRIYDKVMAVRVCDFLNNNNESTLYTRAQMIEFGEKVRDECSCKAGYSPSIRLIRDINIENLLTQEGKK